MVISELGIPKKRLPEENPERSKALQGLLKWTPSSAKVAWPGGDPGLLTLSLLAGGPKNSEQPYSRTSHNIHQDQNSIMYLRDLSTEKLQPECATCK